VEMAVTLDPGTAVDIILWLDNERFPLKVRVVTRRSHFGNGVEFVNLTLESETRLRTFLKQPEGSTLT
jgi:RNA binding exosome subunit